jgi:hypothetical protein
MTSRHFSTASNQLLDEEVKEVNEDGVPAVTVPTVGVSSTPLHHKSVRVEGVFCSSGSSRAEFSNFNFQIKFSVLKP